MRNVIELPASLPQEFAFGSAESLTTIAGLPPTSGTFEHDVSVRANSASRMAIDRASGYGVLVASMARHTRRQAVARQGLGVRAHARKARGPAGRDRRAR